MSLQRFKSQRPATDMPQLLAVLGTRKQQNGLTPQGGWYSITNRDDDAEIHIYDEIGYFGVTANDFIKDITAIKSNRITLRINSPGGEVFDGIAIFNAIKRHKAEVTTYIDGLAASAASFIAMAGDRIVMSPHSQMMIHDAAGLVIGNADDMRQMADILDRSSDNIAAIYAERAGGTVAEWRQRMKSETWISDREAVKLGLADAIDGEEPTSRKPQEAMAAKATVDFLALINQQMEEAAELVA